MRSIIVAGCALVAATIAACSSYAPSETGSIGEALHSTDKRRITPVPKTDNPYTLFESLQVRPLALSPSGRLLFATNTPDNRLEIFKVKRHGLEPIGSVEVGLEPVAVAARSEREVWVINHLSDSVSIVDVGDGDEPRVTRTLLVGDEPRDIVFAGRRHERAFITTAHRGQNSPDDPDLFANVGRADVWVFDANHLGAAAGGERLTKITLFADTPRALAATPDGKTVYAAAFLSGNQTTSVSEDAVSLVYPNGMPGPATVSIGGQTIPQPRTGLIVKWKLAGDGQFHWVDPYGSVFDPFVKVRLPDQDVFAIDATANPPAAVPSGTFAHVGTTLFNMAVNPKNGKVYVSNTDAHNDVRFEGHTPGFTSVVGNIVDSRVTVIDPSTSTVTAANLNPHLDHAAGTGDASLSLAFPQDLTVSDDGRKLYLVAQGSSKLAVYDTALLESGSATPAARNQIHLTGGGPTGLVLDEGRDLAFVHTRFDNAISVVDLRRNREIEHVTMFNPEPRIVTDGRKYLYDATFTSALGDQACSGCHVGGDNDGLAWDLGNPGGNPLPITKTFARESDVNSIPEAAIVALLGEPVRGVFAAYQPLKGPMTTQSLRGLDNHGAMHWRGDRNGAIQQTGLPFLDGGGNPIVSAQPGAGIFDEFNAFKSFNVAFPGLIGRAEQLTDGDMTDFTNFVLQISYPPNPIRNLDDSLTPVEAAGQAFYFNVLPDGRQAPSDRFHNCNGCHVLDRNGNAGASKHPGFFGTDGRLSFENETQIFKVPHLRNMYQKLGMYGSSLDRRHAIASAIPPLNPVVDAVRGFGYQHDGATATVEHFLTAFVFVKTTATVVFNGTTTPPNPFGIPLFADSDDPLNASKGISTDGLALRRALSSFVLAFDSNMKPTVGQQVTLRAGCSDDDAASRIALLEAQAAAGACDLVVRGRLRGRDAGFVYSSGAFLPDRSTRRPLTDAALRALVGEETGALTFTCVPVGSGFRIGIDRDADGIADGDELAFGTDPADPASHP
jgi:DNA-binding beta-propeller fold protein YncE